MMRRTHATAGLASGLALAQTQHDPLIMMFGLVLVSELASLLPDMDLKLGLKHRGVTHSLLALALIVGAGWYVDHRLALPVAVGYSSHLILDMLTIWGIPILWPVKKRFRLAKFSTGGLFDRLLAIVAFCVAILAIYSIVKVST